MQKHWNRAGIEPTTCCSEGIRPTNSPLRHAAANSYALVLKAFFRLLQLTCCQSRGFDLQYKLDLYRNLPGQYAASQYIETRACLQVSVSKLRVYARTHTDARTD